MWGESEDLGFLGGVLDMAGVLCAIGIALAVVLIVVPLILTPVGIAVVAVIGAVLVFRQVLRRG
jgi:hypothetical protein